MKLKASLLLNGLLRIHPLTFITEALRLWGSPSVASISYHISFLRRVFTMCYVNEATPIDFNNVKCHLKQLKSGKAVKLV